MKVIFLDIDGVLTTVTWERWRKFNPVCVKLLKNILLASDYKLVISSTWRNLGLGENSPLNIELTKHKLKEFLHKDWRTSNGEGERGFQIKEWLLEHPEVTDYIILDDDSDMLEEQLPRFIKTSAYNGILFEHYQKLMELIGLKVSDIILIDPIKV